MRQRSIKWLARFLALTMALNVLLGGIVTVRVDALDSKPTEEWVIYRPGTDTHLTSTLNTVRETDTEAQLIVPAGQTVNFYRAKMNLQISPSLSMSDLALRMRLYVEDPMALSVGQIELANQTNDDKEIAWQLSSLNLVSGWNDVVLPFSAVKTFSGADFELYSPINWFRIYSEKVCEAGETVRVENISVTITESGMNMGVTDSYVQLQKPLAASPNTVEASVKMPALDTEWFISRCDGKDSLTNTYDTATLTPDTMEDGTPYMRINITKGGKASIRRTSMGITIPKAYDLEDLAFSLKIYVDDVKNLPSTEIEVTSDTSDNKELHWKTDKLGLQNGWNTFLLPLTEAHGTSGAAFDCHYINFFRWTFSGTVPEDLELGLADVKIVVLPHDDEDGSTAGDAWQVLRGATAEALTIGGGTVAYERTEQDVPYVQVTSTGGAVSVLRENIGLYIPPDYELDELALHMEVYVSDPAALTRWRAELASGDIDRDELQWNANNAVWQEGWNTVELPLASFDASTGAFDQMAIRRFRFLSALDVPEKTVVRLANVKIVPLADKTVLGSPRECGAKTHMILSNTNTGDQTPFAFLVTGDGHPSVIWGDRQVTFSPYLFTGEWTHLAVVRDMSQSAFILYVNGEEVERADAAGTRELTFTTAPCIGSDGAGVNGGIFGGVLGDIRVWDTPRSAAQIAANLVDLTCSRANGFGAATRNLVGSWFLREDLDYVFNVVHDVSKNENHGAIAGSRASDWLDYQKPAFCDDPNYYTIAVLPDIQEMTAGYRDEWTKIATWLRDNTESDHLRYLISMGDSTYNNSDVEWTCARAGYDLFGDRLPYTNLPGNHDYGDWSKPVRNTDNFNKYFSYVDAKANNPYFVGAYEEGRMDNTYYVMTINGINYLVLQLEFRPRQGVLDWANEVLDRYPYHNVIVALHGYIDGKGRVMTNDIEGHKGEYVFVENEDDRNAQDLWDQVINTHDNVRMVLCGHKHSEDVIWRCDQTAKGNSVYQMLFCAQDMDKSYFNSTAVGMLGLLYFSADGSRVAVNYYSPVHDKSFREINQLTFDLDVIRTPYETEPEAVAPRFACEHAKKAWKTVTPATCKTVGEKQYACTACGLVEKSEEIPMTAHKAGKWEITREATCQAAGEQVKRCKLCDEVLETEEIARLEHTFGEWIEDVPATYLVPGRRHRVCTACEEKQEEEIAVLPRRRGDGDGDGQVSCADAVLTLQYAAGLIPEGELSEAALKALDMDGDGKLTTADACIILQMAAGLIAE